MKMAQRFLGRFRTRSPIVVAILAICFTLCAASTVQPQAVSPKPKKSEVEQDVGAAVFLAFMMADSLRSHPSDQTLSTVFNAHRSDFEQLVAMSRTDKNLVRVAPDFIWTTQTMRWPRPVAELGTTQQRWNDYRRLFRLLKLDAGMLRRPEDPQAVVYLMASTKGLVTGGSVKGYARSDDVLSPQCKTLDSPPKSDEEEGKCFKPLAKGWYLYYEWD